MSSLCCLICHTMPLQAKRVIPLRLGVVDRKQLQPQPMPSDIKGRAFRCNQRETCRDGLAILGPTSKVAPLYSMKPVSQLRHAPSLQPVLQIRPSRGKAGVAKGLAGQDSQGSQTTEHEQPESKIKKTCQRHVGRRIGLCCLCVVS